MIKRTMLFLGLLLVALVALGCQQETTLPLTTTATLPQDQEATFYFDQLNTVTFPLGLSPETFVGVEGHNISSADYTLDASGQLTMAGAYLATLPSGTHDFTVFLDDHEVTVRVHIPDQHQANRIINGGFETGDLTGWEASTVFKGETNLQSFTADLVQPVDGTTVKYSADGSYLFGFNYAPDANTNQLLERVGRLRSSNFILGGNGIITFKLGAARNPDLLYVSVRDVTTDKEIARFGNLAFDVDTFLTLNGDVTEVRLNEYYADLSQYLGDSLYIELVDYGGRNYDYMIFDSIETYHESLPQDAIEATNILPTFSTDYVTNTLPNGDFSQGLSLWTVSPYGLAYTSGVQSCFEADSNALKSDMDGDNSRGLIRSSLFRVDGSGIISVDLAAAYGTRFDKDTYVSIKSYETNREVFRFANIHANGDQWVTYYIDLSAFMGDYLYFEIVDNATGTHDVIDVDNIVTFYQTMPSFDYSQMAINLNE